MLLCFTGPLSVLARWDPDGTRLIFWHHHPIWSNLGMFGPWLLALTSFLGSPMHCPLMQNQIAGFLDMQSWGFDSFTYGVPLVHLPFQKFTAEFVGPTNQGASNLWKITILFMGKSSFLSSIKMELSIPMLNFCQRFYMLNSEVSVFCRLLNIKSSWFETNCWCL